MARRTWGQLLTQLLIAMAIVVAGVCVAGVGPAAAQVAAVREGPVLDDATIAALADLEVLRGADIDARSLAGKFVVVNFFASWCAPCRAEFRELGALIDELGPQRIKVVTINWLEDVTHYPQATLQIYRVLDRLHPRITAVRGTDAVSRLFGGRRGIRAIPALFAFDASGAEIYRFQYAGGAAKTHTSAADLRAAFAP